MIIEAIKEKKGRDIVLIDLNKIVNSPCSFFVICSTTSKTQINAIANHLEKVLLEKLKLKIGHQEGKLSNWRLLDYMDVVIHNKKTGRV